MLVFAKTLFPFVIWNSYFVFSFQGTFTLCALMNNSNQTAEATQGVADANAENNSVKTNVVANTETNVQTEETVVETHISVDKDLIDSLFMEYQEDLTNFASQPVRDDIPWFVPTDENVLAKIQFHGYQSINGKMQILFKVCDITEDKFVRLPDDIGILLRGNQTPYASYATVKDYISNLSVIASKYSSRWSSIFDLAKSLMKLEDYTNQEGLQMNLKGKDYLANECIEAKVWTLQNRAKVADIVDKFRVGITEIYEVHPTVMVKLAPRSQGKVGSAIIKSAM